MAGMTKPQKQLLLANGFLAGLAELGVEELNSSNMVFEFPFMHAWRQWPHSQKTAIMPRIDYGSTSQPRDILHRVTSSSSPFRDFEREGITATPHGMPPAEFLEVWCKQLPVDAWVELAQLFLDGLAKYDRTPAETD